VVLLLALHAAQAAPAPAESQDLIPRLREPTLAPTPRAPTLMPPLREPALDRPTVLPGLAPMQLEALLRNRQANECMTMKYFGEGMAAGFQELYWSSARMLAIIAPHPGLRWQRGETARATLSWPWSLPFGPATASTSTHWTCSENVTHEHRPHRIVLEPGLTLAAPLGLFVRPGYRFLWQRASGRLGLGLGLGSTIELRGPATPRASISPELLFRYGRCCHPGYVLLALRYDRFGDGSAYSASLGIRYW
jgi:hypothetical protein